MRMKLNAALLILLLGVLSMLLSSVDSKKCKGRTCSKKGEKKAKVGKLKDGKIKGKKRKPSAPFWKKGPPKSPELIVREDTDLTLNCAIKGRPTPSFTWIVNGKEVTKRKSKGKRQRRHRLLIKNVQMEDGGNYKCVANNSFGQLSFTYTVRVLENVPSEDFNVVDRPENQTSHVGDTVVFMCRSYDWPTPKVNWARRTVGTDVMEIMKIFDNTTDSTDLVLHGVTKKDSGEYICFIGNEKTSKQLSAFLVVIDQSETLPFEPPCSLHVRRQTLSDHTRTCETVEPVEMHYCMGSCGRSYYIPQLVMSDDTSSMFHLNQTCKCCVGVVERLKIVELQCPLGHTKMGFYTLLRACQCQSCTTADESSSTSPSTPLP